MLPVDCADVSEYWRVGQFRVTAARDFQVERTLAADDGDRGIVRRLVAGDNRGVDRIDAETVATIMTIMAIMTVVTIMTVVSIVSILTITTVVTVSAFWSFRPHRSLCSCATRRMIQHAFDQLRQHLNARQDFSTLAIVDACDVRGIIGDRIGRWNFDVLQRVVDVKVFDRGQHHAVWHVAMRAAFQVTPEDLVASRLIDFENRNATFTRDRKIAGERNIDLCSTVSDRELLAFISYRKGAAGRDVLSCWSKQDLLRADCLH